MESMKQVIVIRTDLDMGKGKIAAQVGHACVLGAEHVRKSHPEWYSEWWNGQEKVATKPGLMLMVIGFTTMIIGLLIIMTEFYEASSPFL